MTLALDNFRAATPQRIILAGTELSYRVFGEGPNVLLLHGWPLSGITYRALIEALRPRFRCIVPDLPGAGDTPWAPNIGDSVKGFSELMRTFVDRLELNRLAVIGHDSGGGVARVLAAELGSRVACLILQNTEVPDHVPVMVRALKLTAQSTFATATLVRLLRSQRWRRSRLGFGECFGDHSLIEAEFFEACIRPLLADMRGHIAMLERLDLHWTRCLPEVHARIRAPIHLFWGEQDQFFPLAHAHAMRASFARGGELMVIPNAKLYVHEEAPDELARFTLRLLDEAFRVDRSESVAALPQTQLQS